MDSEAHDKPGTGKIRQKLKAEAHHLKPALSIREGERETAVQRVRGALERGKGLVKIRLESPDKAYRREVEALLAEQADIAVLARLGHLLILANAERIVAESGAIEGDPELRDGESPK